MQVNQTGVEFLWDISKFEKRTKISLLLVTLPIKREIEHLRVLCSRAKAAKKCYKKSEMQVQSCCFAYKTYCYFDVLVAIVSLDLKFPYENQKRTNISQSQCPFSHVLIFLVLSLLLAMNYVSLFLTWSRKRNQNSLSLHH